MGAAWKCWPVLEAGEPVVVQGGFTLKSELEKGAFRGAAAVRTCPLNRAARRLEMIDRVIQSCLRHRFLVLIALAGLVAYGATRR